MCGPYWSQWDYDDLRDFQGYTPPDTEDSEEPSEKQPHDCGRCMYCLGLSTSDFL